MNNNIDKHMEEDNINRQIEPEKKQSIFGSRSYYKPFDYPEFYEAWSKQQSMFWIHFEVNMTDDKTQFYLKLTEDEKEIIIKVLRFFTQSDVEVSRGYISLLNKFQLFEVQSMMAAFLNVETIHAAAYAFLVETLSLPEETFKDFLLYNETREKYDYITSFRVDDNYQTLRTMAFMSGFVEGFMLFSSFIMLLNMSRFKVLQGLAQIATWSMRDETLHNHYMTLLFHRCYEELKDKIDCEKLKKEIKDSCLKLLDLEEKFIEATFGEKKMRGLRKEEVIAYVRRLAKTRVHSLIGDDMSEITYSKEDYPYWIDEISELRELVDFFIQRPTEYVKKQEAWEGDIV